MIIPIRIRSVSAVMLLLAFLCLNKTLYGQIVPEIDMTFLEENAKEMVPDEPVSEPKADIQYVPASTIQELNLPSPGPYPRRFSGKFLKVNSNNKSTLVVPPSLGNNADIPASSNTILPEEYLFRIASSHQWGRFPAGSWKRFRLDRETISYDANTPPKKCLSSAEYTVTLNQLLDDKFCLTRETALSGAGRKWNTTPTTTEINYWGEVLSAENDSLTPVEFQTKQNLGLEIEGITYPCFLEYIVFENKNRRIEIKTWRSDASLKIPQILRQECKKYSKQAGQSDQLSVSSIYQLSPTSIPYAIKGHIHQVWKAEQTEETPQGKSVTTSLLSLAIPGEIVSYSKQQYNKSGNLIGQVTISTLDFGIRCSDSTRKTIFNFRPWRRSPQPVKTSNFQP